VVRARRRAAWDARLTPATAEVAWFARELVPQLRAAAGSPERLAGAWAVGGAERVRALEDELTALAETAPDDADRAQALALRDAVRDGSGRIGVLTAGAVRADAVTELDAVAARLEAALAGPQPAGA
jgi:hypothetical protein